MAQQKDNSKLRDLLVNIEKCEKESMNPQVLQWIQQISDPKNGLINSMVEFFIIDCENIESSNQILRCLKKLNDFNREKVLPQLQKNLNFPKSIIQYINKREVSCQEGDCYILLCEIYSTQGFKNISTVEFITNLFNSFDFINDEKTFLSIAFILISIHMEYKNPQSSKVLEVAQHHKTQRYFSEYLLHLVNKGDEIQKYKTLKFIYDIYQQNIYDFFRKNDLNVLIEVIIRDIQNIPLNDHCIQYLKILQRIIKIQQQMDMKEVNLRKDEITFLMDSFKTNKSNQIIQELAQDIQDLLQ